MPTGNITESELKRMNSVAGKKAGKTMGEALRKAAAGATLGAAEGAAIRRAFQLGNKKMIYDRGRYKESGNVGSVNEKKGSGFLTGAKKAARGIAEGAVGSTAKYVAPAVANVAKAKLAKLEANRNLSKQKTNRATYSPKASAAGAQVKASTNLAREKIKARLIDLAKAK